LSNKEDEFREWMDTIDVVPGARSTAEKHKEAKRQQNEQENAAKQRDIALFEEAMEQLESVPNKEGVGAVSLATDDVEWVKSSTKQSILTQARLDLHGCTEAEALFRLKRFVRECSEDRVSPIIVITGKGQHSPGKRAVLKPAVTAWLQSEGARYVRALGDAPRASGGAGALVVWLRSTTD